jgi:hypothetical protein
MINYFDVNGIIFVLIFEKQSLVLGDNIYNK